MITIRVYGIWISNGRLLVTDEFRLGMRMTKLPGGGLEFGEGTIDCLKREWKEETGLDIEILSHFYTTDFFQLTRFLTQPRQVINIYYLVEPVDCSGLKISDKPFAYGDDTDGAQSFRWLDIRKATEDDFTLHIDKVMIQKLRNSVFREV